MENMLIKGVAKDNDVAQISVIGIPFSIRSCAKNTPVQFTRIPSIAHCSRQAPISAFHCRFPYFISVPFPGSTRPGFLKRTAIFPIYSTSFPQ